MLVSSLPLLLTKGKPKMVAQSSVGLSSHVPGAGQRGIGHQRQALAGDLANERRRFGYRLLFVFLRESEPSADLGFIGREGSPSASGEPTQVGGTRPLIR